MKYVDGGPVTLVTLAEGDDFTCGICAGSVDLLAEGDLGPSIDHVVPRSCGGEHHVRNLQLAHYRCNLDKRGRLGWLRAAPLTDLAVERPLTLF